MNKYALQAINTNKYVTASNIIPIPITQEQKDILERFADTRKDEHLDTIYKINNCEFKIFPLMTPDEKEHIEEIVVGTKLFARMSHLCSDGHPVFIAGGVYTVKEVEHGEIRLDGETLENNPFSLYPYDESYWGFYFKPIHHIEIGNLVKVQEEKWCSVGHVTDISGRLIKVNLQWHEMSDVVHVASPKYKTKDIVVDRVHGSGEVWNISFFEDGEVMYHLYNECRPLACVRESDITCALPKN